MGIVGGELLKSGWHEAEQAGALSWIWSHPDAEIVVPCFEKGDFLVVDYAGQPHGEVPVICTVSSSSGASVVPVESGRGKMLVDLGPLSAAEGDTLTIKVSNAYMPPGDPRRLGIMVFGVEIIKAHVVNYLRRESGLRELPLVADYTPSELSIAVSDKCNLRCVTCFAHHRQEGDNNANLDDFPVEMIPSIKDAAMGAARIQIHSGAGEPLLARNFWDWFALLDKNPTAKIEFNTNGITLNAKNIEKLLTYNVDHISVSFDAATPEIYADIRGGDFARLLDNMRELIRQRSRSTNPIRVLFNLTVTRANVVDAPGLVRLAHEIGVDGVELYHLNSGKAYDWTVEKNGKTFNYRENLPEANAAFIRPFIENSIQLAEDLGIYLFVDPRFQATLYGRADETSQVMPEVSECRAPWHWMAFETNGNVRPCCMAGKPIGNLKSATALEIWNGRAMQRLRRNIKENKLDPICVGGSCRYVMKAEMEKREIEAAKEAVAATQAAQQAEIEVDDF